MQLSISSHIKVDFAATMHQQYHRQALAVAEFALPVLPGASTPSCILNEARSCKMLLAAYHFQEP